MYDKEETEIKTVDSWLIDNSYNPETVMFDYENSHELIKKIGKILTDFELQVFELKLAGFSYIEISEILDKDKKQIDNAIQTIKSKIKGKINELNPKNTFSNSKNINNSKKIPILIISGVPF